MLTSHALCVCICVYVQIAAHLADALVASGSFRVLNNPKEGSVPLVTFSLLPYKPEVIVSDSRKATQPSVLFA